MLDASARHPAAPAAWRRWLLWTVLLVLWSAALLTPHPVRAGRAVLPAFSLLIAGKVLHVSAYAVLAWLGLRLPGSPRLHILVLAFLAVHASATELLQTLVRDRTGSWRDVALDCLGILVGLALSRLWKKLWGTFSTCPPPGTLETCPTISANDVEAG